MNSKPEDIVRCRVQCGMWIFPALMAGLAVFYAIDHFVIERTWELDTRLVIAMVCMLLLVSSLGTALWFAVFEIRADDQGLRWRTLTGWRFEPWSSVTDYYFAPTSGGVRRIAVVFGDRKLEFDARITNQSILQDYVQSRSAIPGGRSWGMRGARDTDPWPREFRYGRWAPPGLLAAAIAMSVGLACIAFVVIDIWRMTTDSDYGDPMPPSMRLMFLGVNVTGIVFVVIMARFTFTSWTAFLYVLRRSKMVVTATPDILLQQGKDGETRIPWSEIDKFEHRAKGPWGWLGGYVVRSRSDNIEFSSVIGNLSVLKATILANTSGLSVE